MASILITGASGFVGSFIVEEALRRGFDVWAGVRASSSRRYLQDRRIRFFELDFARKEQMTARLQEHKRTQGAFDYIIHCAGVTKCADAADFHRFNYQQTKDFIDVLMELDMVPHRFLHVSTLSIYGPVRERDFSPIREGDTPQPNTAYGRSKLLTERYLQSLEGFPYLIFRPTGVYGPREQDYYLMAKSIKQHVDFTAGLGRQDITFIYVKDLVQVFFLAIERGVCRRAYNLSDGAVYSSTDFSRLIQRELGHPFVLRFRCPLWLLKGISHISGFVAGRLGRSSTLNPDKYNIMKQRNWQCDITPAVNELGYTPRYDLERGVRETIAWYKENKWL